MTYRNDNTNWWWWVSFQVSIEATLNTMQTILQRTLTQAKEEAGAGNPLTVCHLELKLVQSLEDIRSPVSKVTATPLLS